MKTINIDKTIREIEELKYGMKKGQTILNTVCDIIKIIKDNIRQISTEELSQKIVNDVELEYPKEVQEIRKKINNTEYYYQKYNDLLQKYLKLSERYYNLKDGKDDKLVYKYKE